MLLCLCYLPQGCTYSCEVNLLNIGVAFSHYRVFCSGTTARPSLDDPKLDKLCTLPRPLKETGKAVSSQESAAGEASGGEEVSGGEEGWQGTPEGAADSVSQENLTNRDESSVASEDM